MSIDEELKKKLKRHSKISWEVLKFPDTEEEKGEETMKKNACLMRLTVEVEYKSSKVSSKNFQVFWLTALN